MSFLPGLFPGPFMSSGGAVVVHDAWEVAGQMDFSVLPDTPPPLEFLNLGNYQDLFIVANGLSHNSIGSLTIGLQFSFDNGASYDTGTNYIYVNDTATLSTSHSMMKFFDLTQSGATNSFRQIMLSATNIIGPKNSLWFRGAGTAFYQYQYFANLNPITALRVVLDGSADFDDGSITVLGRTGA